MWTHCYWNNTDVVFSGCTESNIFFPSFCQQKHADAHVAQPNIELASAPVCISKSFMILYSSDHY